MIEIQQLSKRYQETLVLNQITTSLPDSGIISIIGPNGAGKSTLLSIMGRLLSADTGRVIVNNCDVSTTNSQQLAQSLAILRQENHFNSRLTVEELVGFGRYPYSQGRLTADDQQKIEQSLAFLQLTELRRRFLDQLSGGQRQRAYIAMILCQDTQYLLLDEPLNNLDMKHAVTMMKLLRQAADQLAKTIILVIHDINFASVYSDQIIAMKNGHLCYQGTPAQLMQSAILQDIFETPMTIQTIDDKRLALYF